MGGLDVINILDGLDGLLKKTSWMDGLDVINILDGLDGCPSDGMDWMLDGLLTTLYKSMQSEATPNLPEPPMIKRYDYYLQSTTARI